MPERGSNPLIALYISYTDLFFVLFEKKSHQDLGSQANPVNINPKILKCTVK
jgi:hypothetical protein